MQVDRMFRAEAEITIKQNIQERRGGIYTMKGYSALTYNCIKTVTCKHSFKSSAINGGENGGKKTRNCRCADWDRRQKMNIEIINHASYHFILQKL